MKFKDIKRFESKLCCNVKPFHICLICKTRICWPCKKALPIEALVKVPTDYLCQVGGETDGCGLHWWEIYE